MSFVHLSGPRRGQTDRLTGGSGAIGSEPGLEVLVPGIAPRHALVLTHGADVVLQDGGSEDGTFLAGQAVREAVLRDGDVLELGSGGPLLRFRREGAEPPVPLLQALRWARPEGAPTGLADTVGLLRAFARESAARTSRPFRAVLLATLGVSGLLLGWSVSESRRLRQQVARLEEAVRASEEARRGFEARIGDERQRADAASKSLEARIEEFRQREETLSRRLAEAQSGEVLSLRDELRLARERLSNLESERAAGERIIKDYGAGVCLIQGSYAFYSSASRPLRRRVDDSARSQHDDGGAVSLDVDAGGPVYTVDYFGTGFLVDRSGLVLTNRHVAEPWSNDATAQAAVQGGFRPRFVVFRAFFPRQAQPFALEVDRIAEKVDLALLRIDLRKRRVPVLPLDRTGAGAVAGQPVVVVGYPTGLEAILAKADGSVVSEILETHGTSSQQLAEALSRRGLIRPSTTQGHIGDLTRTDLVFDAPTTLGGSGGPIFNRNAQVIGVEYAVLQKFGGNSFGVPIGYALELMRSRAKNSPTD